MPARSLNASNSWSSGSPSFFSGPYASEMTGPCRVERTVISTGGGLPAKAENLTSLKRHSLVVCLWASAEVIWERVKHQTHRPLLRSADPLETIRKLLVDRGPFYKQADVLVHTEQRPAKEVAQHVLHQFYAVRDGQRDS